MALNIDAAAANLLGGSTRFQIDPEKRPGFDDDEYSIGRYTNTEQTYFLVTNKSLRLFSSGDETIVWYQEMLAVNFEGAFTAAQELNRDWKRNLQHENKRLLRIELCSGDPILLQVTGERKDRSLDIFSVQKFLSKVVFFERKKDRAVDLKAVQKTFDQASDDLGCDE